MYNLLVAVVAAIWMSLVTPIVLRYAKANVAAMNAPAAAPFLLVLVFSFMPLVFNIEREDALALLQQGLSASNRVEVALTGLAALYLAYRTMIDRRILIIPFSQPYLPFTLLLIVDGISALWSIQPIYTVFRTVEVGTFSLMTILIFDRSDIARRLPGLLALVVLVWLLVVTPQLVASAAHGIVFSAAKNNMMPLVCAALLMFAALHPNCPRRKAYVFLGFAGFVIAGSAASTGALAGALLPAFLLASEKPARQMFGMAAFTVAMAAFTVAMFGLANFPALLSIASTILQKPAIELANGTGRDEFWPAFLDATRSHVFGSGFSAGDHFIQLLIPTGNLAADLGRDAIHISSAHNMYLSAWSGTGIIGVVLAVIVLATAIGSGMRMAEKADRRFVLSVVLMLALNGMTTPGIFQDWTVNQLGFIALLAFLRVEETLVRSAPVVASGWTRSRPPPYRFPRPT